MKKTRWIFLVSVVVVLLGLGIAYAFTTGASGPAPPSRSQMHNAPGMQQMHQQMPAASQAECNEARTQIATMMSGQMGAGMMGSVAS